MNFIDNYTDLKTENPTDILHSLIRLESTYFTNECEREVRANIFSYSELNKNKEKLGAQKWPKLKRGETKMSKDKNPFGESPQNSS